MDIGLIVDGQAEYRSLPGLYQRLNASDRLLTPIYADIQPLAPLPQIVGAVKRKLPLFRNKDVRKIIVLLDRENRDVCPGTWASDIQHALERHCASVGEHHFVVVVKESCYENWLVSDPDVFSNFPKRFHIRPKHLKLIRPDKADNADAQSMLKSMVQDGAYNKVEDAMRIMGFADPLKMAQNSRSFRRFLRTVGHLNYLNQSRRPSI